MMIPMKLWPRVLLVVFVPVMSAACSSVRNLPRDAGGDSQTTVGNPSDAIDSGFLLTVTKDGLGQGSVVSIPPSIDCGLICSGTFKQIVTLVAKANGGNYFDGWTGDCAGQIGPECSLVVDVARSVTATFSKVRNNLVFATSAVVDGAFGGIAAADALCGEAATKGNLPGTYLAWLSTSTVDAASYHLRLPATCLRRCRRSLWRRAAPR
jgi:hypothetical protein